MVTAETLRDVRSHRSLGLAEVPALAALLTALVMGVAPAVILLTDAHALRVLTVVLAVYGLLVLVADAVESGVVAAIPVLATVNADLPIRPGPSRTVDLALVVGDGAMLAGIALLAGDAVARWYGAGTGGLGGLPIGERGREARSARKPTVRDAAGEWRSTVGWPGLLLAGFAGWALLGAAFAAHDPTTAATFGILQFRYVVYFAAVAALVARGLATVRGLSVAFAIAVVGHSLFALAQFANGEPMGFTRLGETIHDNELPLGWFGIDQYRGRYLGGLAGNNAAYATLAVPAVAVAVWIGDQTRGRSRGLAGAAIALVALLCLSLTQYDSVRIAFATVFVGSLALATLPNWPAWAGEPILRDRARSLGIVLAVGAAAVVLVLAVGAVAVFDLLPGVSSKNLGPRLSDYANAVAVALRHPLFGYGGGNVEPVGSQIGFSDDIAIHSVLFSYLAETGFVGAGLWTAAVIATGWRAVRLAWARSGRDVVAYLCVGAVGFLMIAMIDQIWDNHTSMGVFWLFAGAIVGAYHAEVGD